MYNDTSTSVAQTLVELPALVENLLLLLSEKEKSVITRRFDLGVGRKYTLEEIGKDFAVTRERIRQIEKNALSKMKRNVFNTSLKNIHDYVSVVLRENGGLIREDLLQRELVSVLPDKGTVNENNVHFSLVLHDAMECVGNTVIFHPYVRGNALSDYSLKFASNHLVNQLHKYGDVKGAEKVHDDLKSVFTDIGLDLKMMRSLVRIDKRVTLLDDDFIGLMEWRHIHPRTLRDKILYVLRNEGVPMHFGRIADRISDSNFDNRSINLQAVHNELIRHDSFVLIGRGIYALNEWGYERGTVAEVIEKLLREKGEMSQDEIVDSVLKRRQVKKITIVLALKNNLQFERVGRKRYRLKA